MVLGHALALGAAMVLAAGSRLTAQSISVEQVSCFKFADNQVVHATTAGEPGGLDRGASSTAAATSRSSVRNTPGKVMLRAAQPVGMITRKNLRLAAVRPFDAAQARLP